MFIKLNEDGQPVGNEVSMEDIRRANPNISFPELPDGYGKIGYQSYPTVDQFQQVEMGELTLVGDEWMKPFIVSDLSLDDAKKVLRKMIGEKRWAVETAGLVIGGNSIDTSISSQNRISNVVASGLRKGLTQVQFKKPDGSFVTLTIEDVVAIADAITDRVDDCFTAESEHCAAVNALTSVQDVRTYSHDDINNGWPL